MAPKREAEIEAELQQQTKRLKDASDTVASEFTCAISYELPINPVTAGDGQIYERGAIEAWIAKTKAENRVLRSPKHNTPMGPRLLQATHVRNILEQMVSSGAINGPKAAAWWKKLENEKELEMAKKRDAEHVASVRAKAEDGDGDAILELGIIYCDGKRGLPKDRVEAVVWFQRGHTLDHASCTMQLGGCYKLGYGLEKSFSMATYLYVIAAKNGSEHACYELGHSIACEYSDMKRDEPEVTRWFRAMEKATCRDSFPDCRTYAARWLRQYAAE